MQGILSVAPQGIAQIDGSANMEGKEAPTKILPSICIDHEPSSQCIQM